MNEREGGGQGESVMCLGQECEGQRQTNGERQRERDRETERQRDRQFGK